MRHVNDVMKYDGGDIKTGIMYTGGAFKLDGKYSFRVFGKCVLDGVTITDSEVSIEKTGKLTVSKDSAILFSVAPNKPAKTPEGFEPVPPVPDYMDDATRSIAMMIDEVLRTRGLLPAEGADQFDDDDIDDDDSDSLVKSVSSLTLLPNPNSEKTPEPETPQILEDDMEHPEVLVEADDDQVAEAK